MRLRALARSEHDDYSVADEAVDRITELEDMLSVFQDIEAELARARSKFPGNAHTMNALTEETGELAQALLHLQFEGETENRRVYAEAIQVAVMAIRVAMDGDSTFPAYRPEIEKRQNGRD